MTQAVNSGGGQLYTLSPNLKMIPSHGPQYEKQTLQAGLSYISSNLIYVIVFILLTLGIYWAAGGKAAFYFLLLVLLGQLVTNANFLSQLFK